MSVFLPFTYKWSVCRVGLRRTCIGPFLPKMYVINVINVINGQSVEMGFDGPVLVHLPHKCM